MRFFSYNPSPPLSEFVALLWLYEGYAPEHGKERVLPDGSVELVINLREDALRVYDRQDTERFESFGRSLVSGPRAEYIVIDTVSRASIMGVHFRPGGAFPFLGLPACELQGLTVALEDLWGRAAAELREQLLAAASPEEKFRILERVLLAQAARPLARHPAVGFALKTLRAGPHARTVSQLAGQTGLSARRFIQLFSEEVGLTPKLFCRIRRFQRVLRLVEHAPRVEWADVALTCGYFDQSHFIHDFRAFAGLNPTAYLACRSEHLNHVPLAD